MRDSLQLYERMLGEARRDPDVIGLIVCGSRGKGLETVHSDFDCCIVVQDGVVAECQEKYEALVEYSAVFDRWTLDLQAFAKRPPPHERYDFAQLSPQIDKTAGCLQAILDENSRVPAAERRMLGRFRDAFAARC